MLRVGDIVEVFLSQTGYSVDMLSSLPVAVVEGPSVGGRGCYVVGFPMDARKLLVFEREVKVIGHVEGA
jgi:hypothetical protein